MLSIFLCFSSHYCEGGGQTNAFVSMSVLNTALECREFRRKRHFCLAANTPRNMQHVARSRHPSPSFRFHFSSFVAVAPHRSTHVARTRTLHYSKKIVSKSASFFKEFLSCFLDIILNKFIQSKW
ncbi:GM19400 [Drosophila sechellia]|uniref:GM19400 n=1 Tax=Drosophila sechellia TaxID=7238 RepID=B4HIK6_DROSE|nr:GM19400 [Drosophila sechellia]